MIFIAVGTPQGEDGSADLQHVLGVAREIAMALGELLTCERDKDAEDDAWELLVKYRKFRGDYDGSEEYT